MRLAIRRYVFAVLALFILTIVIVRVLRPRADSPAGPDPIAEASPAATPVRGPGRAVVLFFADPLGNGLVARRSEVFATGDTASLAIEAVTQLLRGPAALPVVTPLPGAEPEVVPLAAVPEGVTLRALFLDGKGTATVDLGGLAQRMSGQGTEGEVLALWAVVDTLAFNFPVDARRVRILIDGQEAESLGHVALDAPLAPRRDLVSGDLPSLATPFAATAPDPDAAATP